MRIIHDEDWLSPEAAAARDSLCMFILKAAAGTEPATIEQIVTDTGFPEMMVRVSLAFLTVEGFISFADGIMELTESGGRLLTVLRVCESSIQRVGDDGSSGASARAHSLTEGSAGRIREKLGQEMRIIARRTHRLSPEESRTLNMILPAASRRLAGEFDEEAADSYLDEVLASG